MRMTRQQMDELIDRRRLYGEDFIVDETLWHGRVVDGRPFLMPGMSGKVSFRLLHVFELREGRISSEQVWCDLAALQQQLNAAAEASASGLACAAT